MAKKEERLKKQIKDSQDSFFKKYFYELFVFLFCLLLYSNSISNGYNMDDELVTRSHRLTSKGITAIPEIFSSPYYSDESGYAYEYRPVVLASFAIEHSLFGDNPRVSHFFNWILYAFGVVLVIIALHTIFSNYPVLISFAVALLFAAHPSHTEVVCSIKNRDEILGLIFGMLALLIALKAVRENKLVWLFASSLLLLLCFMCKITFISLAIIIPMLIIFCYEVNWVTLLWILATTLIPSYLMLDLSSFYTKLMVVAGIVGGSVFFYCLVRPSLVINLWISVKIGAKDFGQKLLQPQVENSTFSGYKNWVNGVIPPASYFRFSALFTAASLFAFYLFALKWQSGLLLFVLPSLLFCLSVLGNERLSYWAKVFFYACLTGGVCYLFFDNNYFVFQERAVALLGAILFFEFFSGKEKLKLPVFLFLTIMSLTAIVMEKGHSYGFSLVLTGAFFFFLWWPKGRYGVVITGLIMIAYIADQLRHSYLSPPGGFAIDVVPYVSLILGAFIYFKKGTRFIVGLYAILLISVFHQAIKIEPFQNKIENAGHRVDINIYKVKADRPMGFIENPISNNTPASIRLGTALHILFHYLHKVIIPSPLAFYYGYKFIEPESIFSPIPVISLLLHLLLTLLAIWLTRKNKLLSSGLWIYLISMAIYSNYFAPAPGILADRFLMLPSLGYCMFLIMGSYSLWSYYNPGKTISRSNLPLELKYPFLIILILYTGLTFCRNFDWKDSVTLMRKDISYVNESAQAHNLLALNLMKSSLDIPDSPEQKELWREAALHFGKSIEIYPYTFNVIYDLGRVYGMLNLPDSSLYYFHRADSIVPGNKLPALQMSLGTLYQQKGENDSALACYLRYVELLPDNFDGYDRLGYLYFHMGMPEKALEISKTATHKIPADYRCYFNVARSFVGFKQNDSALYYLKKAHQLNPGDPGINQAINSLEASH